MIGFCVAICLKKGDVKRWEDNDKPVDDGNV